jgi:putative transposase
VLTEHGLKIAPSTYYAHRSRPPSQWAVRDEHVLAAIERIYHDPQFGRGLYGAWKDELQHERGERMGDVARWPPPPPAPGARAQQAISKRRRVRGRAD